jgi:mono/diheme cytochrome c family protein
MMKKILIVSVFAGLVIGLISCGNKREPGRTYMPDMTYSRAYETYTPAQERLAASGAYYSGKPVEGTVARGDMAAYSLKNDSAGYVQSTGIKNPLDIAAVNMKDAERLYLINCGICHGAKLDGNGPLWKDGNGPYSAAPKSFMADDMKAMAEGTMFHSVTYGKGQMGSYASQLSTKQRWMVIAYIKSKQGVGSAAAATTDSTATKVDSMATTMKK